MFNQTYLSYYYNSNLPKSIQRKNELCLNPKKFPLTYNSSCRLKEAKSYSVHDFLESLFSGNYACAVPSSTAIYLHF